MAADWAWPEAVGARLGDRRRVRTLARVLSCLLMGQGLSWSQALRRWRSRGWVAGRATRAIRRRGPNQLRRG